MKLKDFELPLEIKIISYLKKHKDEFFYTSSLTHHFKAPYPQAVHSVIKKNSVPSWKMGKEVVVSYDQKVLDELKRKCEGI